MTLYYTIVRHRRLVAMLSAQQHIRNANKRLQVFMLLVFEMGVFMMLIIPFPNTIRRKIFT